MSITAFKVAMLAAALCAFLYVLMCLRVRSFDIGERIRISMSDSGYLVKNHLPLVIVTIAAMLCGLIAMVALVIAAGAFLVGA